MSFAPIQGPSSARPPTRQRALVSITVTLSLSFPLTPAAPALAGPEGDPPDGSPPGGAPQLSPLDEALAELPPVGEREGELAAIDAGPAQLRLIDISLDLLFAAGGSTERDASLVTLQGGGHDPRKRGFTLQNLELSFLGAVDPYFTGEAHIIYFLEPPENESRFEIEEAFLTTLELPFDLEERGFELEAGLSFTEFGRLNPLHPHAWDWLDQPVVHTRFFGPDGMRGLGARLGWLAPLPWFAELHFSIQNPEGETMPSFLASEEFFEERPIGGSDFSERDVRGFDDFVYLLRLENAWDIGDEVTVIAGVSGLTGPNATGADARTWIYGGDFFLKWMPADADRGWPFVTWQTELLGRRYEVEDGSPDRTLEDWGLYTQVLWGFVRDWAAGLRYEIARGSGASTGTFAGRDEDPFRDDRQRIAPLVEWVPTHFSRVRLQYNFDVAQHLEDEHAHSVWLGFEILFGKHPAHGL